jgi:hypothetical protein
VRIFTIQYPVWETAILGSVDGRGLSSHNSGVRLPSPGLRGVR